MMIWNSKSERTSRRLARAGGLWALVAIAMSSVLAACNTDRLLDVKAPDRVPAELFDSPTQAALMVNSAIGDFECAYGSYTVVQALISDELGDAQLGAAAWSYDRRDANLQPNGIYGTNGCNNNQNPGLYTPLSTARWAADNALTKLQGWTDQEVSGRTGLIAKAALYAGFSYSAMAMSMCEAAFDLGAPINQQAMFAKAEERFSVAIAAATAAGLPDVASAAYVGRARVRLFVGNTQGADDDAKLVPAGFVLNASAGSDNTRRYNRVNAATRHSGNFTVELQSRQLMTGPGLDTTGAVLDPRTQVELTAAKTSDPAAGPYVYAATKYPGNATPIPIARYAEAQLIRAEIAGGAAAVPFINGLRSKYPGLPSYTGPTDAASIKQLIIEERRRELFLEGFRNYDFQRFSLPMNPAPGTPFPKGGSYGKTTCLPLPDIERFNNPNVPPAS
jgi:hypothetical protein